MRHKARILIDIRHDLGHPVQIVQRPLKGLIIHDQTAQGDQTAQSPGDQNQIEPQRCAGGNGLSGDRLPGALFCQPELFTAQPL